MIHSPPRRASIPIFTLSVLVLLSAGAVARAGDDAAEEIGRGRLLFRIHCASCHGMGAKGDGPVAEALKKEVPDLTRLAERAGGEFPAAEVRRQIDGRDQPVSHGSREMPVWGLSLAEPGRATEWEDEVSAKLDALVRYLGSIQAPADKAAPPGPTASPEDSG